MVDIARKTKVLDGIKPEHVPYADLLAEGRPVVMKGLARDWPIIGHQQRRLTQDARSPVMSGRPICRAAFSTMMR